MEFHHLRYMRLDEEDAFLRGEACRQPIENHLLNIGLKCAYVFCPLHTGEGMDIHNTVDAFIFVLEANIVLNRSQVVSYVLSASGSCAGKDSFLHEWFSAASLASNLSSGQLTGVGGDVKEMCN